MPTSQQILDGLSAITNNWRILAVAWHVVFGAVLIAFVLGWRPTKRRAGTLSALPLASVSALAWLAGNPFNGTVFAILAAVLAGQAVRLPGTRVRLATPWLIAAGGLMVAFGWAYPHFLRAASWATYLYAAPLGLIPCPTLSALIGVSMMLDGLESRSWPATLAAGGVVYGLIGWLRLGVAIDVVLFTAAAVGLFLAIFRHAPPGHEHRLGGAS